MIPEHKITEIYFIVDEFFKEFDNTIKEHSLGNVKTSKRNRKFTMSESEVMLSCSCSTWAPHSRT